MHIFIVGCLYFLVSLVCVVLHLNTSIHMFISTFTNVYNMMALLYSHSDLHNIVLRT